MSAVHYYDEFYIFRGEYLAVRNDKEGFFLCQAHQNIHRASKKIKIQWLRENEKSKNDKGDIYIKEFYDTIGLYWRQCLILLTKV